MIKEHVVQRDSSGIRRISDLSRNPKRPLSQDEKNHFGDYMSLKNGDKSTADVNLTFGVGIVKRSFGQFLFVSEAR